MLYHVLFLFLAKSAQIPLVVVMALPEETKTNWFQKTINSLIENNYDYIIMPATPKHSEIPGANASETIKMMNLHIRHKSDGQKGCWVSHLRAWTLQQALKRPIISLEADTHALLPWKNIASNSKNDWKNYDILFLHKHPQRRIQCPKKTFIQHGLKTRYATGAMLFTGKTNLSTIIDMIDTVLPIGHWLNFIEKKEKLRVGTLCPSLFNQQTKKKSLTQN